MQRTDAKNVVKHPVTHSTALPSSVPRLYRALSCVLFLSYSLRPESRNRLACGSHSPSTQAGVGGLTLLQACRDIVPSINRCSECWIWRPISGPQLPNSLGLDSPSTSTAVLGSLGTWSPLGLGSALDSAIGMLIIDINVSFNWVEFQLGLRDRGSDWVRDISLSETQFPQLRDGSNGSHVAIVPRSRVSGVAPKGCHTAR